MALIEANVNRPNVLKGIALVAAAVFMFALSDATGKHLLMRYSVSMIAGVRYFVNVALLLVLLWPRMGAALWHTERTKAVAVRGICLVFGTLTMSYALRVMPVGEAVSILYLSPFFVMLLAGILLGEHVTWVNWVGAAFGFAGVLLIARPGGGLDPFGVALMLINAGIATAYALLTRVLAKTESTVALLFHTAVWGALIFAGLFLLSGEPFAPSLADFMLMCLLGVFATAGHFLFTAAYREAPASLLAPVNYLHIVFATGLGLLVFGHVPDALALAGMAAIVVSGMGVAVHSHFNRKLESRRMTVTAD